MITEILIIFPLLFLKQSGEEIIISTKSLNTTCKINKNWVFLRKVQKNLGHFTTENYQSRSHVNVVGILIFN